MKFFTTPNSKNIIATLYIVTIEKSELTFLLIHVQHAERDKWKCEQKVMLPHLQDHKNTLKSLIKEWNTLLLCMINNYGKTFCNVITNCIMNRLRESQVISLKTKNKKTYTLDRIKTKFTST